ncbi:MAG: 6,7-dimethyl-8-ribityllumazine synthase [Pseudomonadota bacterium]|jgi:6,7-dimethyl-8-ribityllumazine synthase
MLDANQGQALELDGRDLHIGIVQARFNAHITDALAQACTDELRALGVERIHLVKVPGALEVPLALQALAERAEFDALIALGCIIRGETYHFELVANESGAGVTRVGLDYNLPIANAVLTTENEAQAIARQTDKGRDAARVAVEMALLLEELGADQEAWEDVEDPA